MSKRVKDEPSDPSNSLIGDDALLTRRLAPSIGTGEWVFELRLSVDTTVEPAPLAPPSLPAVRKFAGSVSGPRTGESEVGPSASGRASTGKVDPGAASSTQPPPPLRLLESLSASSTSDEPGELSRRSATSSSASGRLSEGEREIGLVRLILPAALISSYSEERVDPNDSAEGECEPGPAVSKRAADGQEEAGSNQSGGRASPWGREDGKMDERSGIR